MSELIKYPTVISSSEGDIFGMLRMPPANSKSGPIIVHCPAVGTDYNTSYLSFRKLQDELARQGCICFSLDYLNTGSSSNSTSDRDLFSSFVFSVSIALDYLRKHFPNRKVILVGFRLGATIATICANQQKLDGLIIWNPVLKGSNLIREIKLLQNASDIQHNDLDNLELSGVIFDSKSEEALNEINLSESVPNVTSLLAIIDSGSKRFEKIIDRWEEASNEIQVTKAKHSESELLMIDAHLAGVAQATNNSIKDWINSSLSAPDEEETSFDASAICNEMLISSGIKESYKYQNDIFYSHVSPQNSSLKTKLVFLNSGSNHSVGPHRLYVELSRELAKIGYDSFRLDLPGLGESPSIKEEDENLSYMPHPTQHIEDWFKSNFNGEESLILIGLCSGAFHSFKAAVESESLPIKSVILINPLTYYWEEGMTINDAPSVNFGKWNWYKQSLKDPNRWKKLLSGKVKLGPLISVVLGRLKSQVKARSNRSFSSTDNHSDNFVVNRNIPRSLERLEELNREAYMIFSENDPGYDILQAEARKTLKKLKQKNILNITTIPNADHTFSRLDRRNELTKLVVEYLKNR